MDISFLSFFLFVISLLHFLRGHSDGH
jgi:hypothetical protein